MLNFSASTHAKHFAGIQPKWACKNHEKEDCIKDKGIVNQHGVWFIPNPRPNHKYFRPPAIFQDLKFVPHMYMAIQPDGKLYY